MDLDDTILFKDFINHLDSGVKCDLCFITADKNRDTGGEFIEVKAVVKYRLIHVERKKIADKIHPVHGVKTDPKHYEHSTRNIKLANGDIRKIHLRLVRKFNNKIIL